MENARPHEREAQETLVKSRPIVRVPDAKTDTEDAYILESELNVAH